VNADSEAAIADLVARALQHNEQNGEMMDDALQDLRQTEAEVRSLDAAAHRELANLRRKVDTAAVEDVDAYAQALVDRQGAPKPTSAKIAERIRDLELRTIPSADTALWLIVEKVITALDPEVGRVALARNLPRWAPPARVQDPSGIFPAPKAGRPRDERRPDDIVQWVLDAVDRVQRAEAKYQTEQDREKRKREAERRVAADKREYVRAQEQLLHDQEASMTPGQLAARSVMLAKGGQLYPPYDSYAFLKREGLEADYNWVQPGSPFADRKVTVEGNPAAKSAMHAGPATEPAPETGPVGTPA
jgi:hypothetical protein